MRKFMGRLSILFLMLAISGRLLLADVGEIKKVDFTPEKDAALIVVYYEGTAKFRTFQSEKQSNVIIEAENLSVPASLTKVVDAGGVDGPVLQITPYSSQKQNIPMAKLVVQLRGKATVSSRDIPGRFVLEVKRKKMAFSPTISKKGELPTIAFKGTREEDELRSKNFAADKSEEVAKKLVSVLNSSPEEKAYFGSRVTFEGSAVEVHDIFRLVGEASSLNIITDSDVKYSSNYSVKDIPWDQLLDIVLQQAQLKAGVTGNVVRIVTLKKYTEEQEAKLKEIDIADGLEPVVMAVVPLSFATAEDMKKMIETLLVKRNTSGTATAAPAAPAAGGAAPAGGGGAAAPAAGASGNTSTASGTPSKVTQDFVRGEIQVDSRSNSLVITNTRDTIERIRKLVKELDVALPQVLIDAKIVIASENFTRSVGVSWGGRGTSSGTGRAGIGAGFDTSSISLGDNSNAPTFSVSPSAGEAPGGAIGFQVGAGRHGNLNAQLKLAEANGLSKTVASPRVVVNNKKQAQITDGRTFFLATTPGANAAGELKEVKVNLNLTVTPQVTSVGSVLLNLNLTKDEPGDSGSVQNKSMSTEVLVDSGSTLVLGGVYQFLQSQNEQGIPLLKDLPFIGQIFRRNSSTTSKSELMVFITPQILEPKGSEEGVEGPTTL